MILEWTRSKTPLVEMCRWAGAPGRDFDHTLALVAKSGGDTVAVVAIHDWNPEAETVEISGAAISPRAPIRRMARIIADHVFGEMQCQAAVWRTASTNRKVRRIAKTMGGQEYIIPRLRGRSASEALIVITQEAWQASKWS